MFIKHLIEILKSTKCEIYIPDCIRRRSLEYLTYSHWFFKWFLDNYEKLDKNEIQNPNDYITIQSVFTNLKNDDYFKSLSQSNKRQCTKKFIIDLITKSDIFSEYYINEVDTRYQGKKVHKTNVLKGWRQQQEENNFIQDEFTQPIYGAPQLLKQFNILNILPPEGFQ